MDFKEEAQKILQELSLQGIDRRRVEVDLGYKQFYIDQALSKGGNKKFVAALTAYFNGKSYLKPVDGKITAERALLKVLVREFAEYKVKYEPNLNVDDVVADIENKAKTILDIANGV